VDVSVTRGDNPVSGLMAAHFEVLDNGVPQVVDRVSREDVPLNVMLVLDSSGSLAGYPLTALVDAAQGLVRSLRPGDRVGLLAFSQRIDLPVPPTARHEEVLSALGRLTAGGPTALRDALFTGLQLVPPDGDARPVLVLFSDGRDTASWMAAGDLEGVVRRSGVVLHAVELVGTPRTLGRTGREGGAGDVRDARLRSRVNGRPVGINESRSLQRAVEAGGGRLWSAAAADELKELFAEALDELRARYLLTYTPQGVASSGWHEVKVRLKGARGDVRARPGYFVPPERREGPPPKAAHPKGPPPKAASPGPAREARPTVARASRTRRP
jgi:VWFA-related protein